MRQDFLPRADGELRAWTRAFGNALAAGEGRLPVDAGEVAAYLELQAGFARRLADAVGPETRGVRTVFLKDEARRALVDETRRLARRVRGAGVGPGDLQVLGLAVPKGRRRRAPGPGERPFLVVALEPDGALRLDLRREVVESRARPDEAMGALVLGFVARSRDEVPPAGLAGWAVWDTTPAMRATVRLGAVAPGVAAERAWLSAAWVGPRLQVGPLAGPVRASSVWDGPAFETPAGDAARRVRPAA